MFKGQDAPLLSGANRLPLWQRFAVFYEDSYELSIKKRKIPAKEPLFKHTALSIKNIDNPYNNLYNNIYEIRVK